MEDLFEYELIDVEWSINYEFSDLPTGMVCDASGNKSDDTENKNPLILDEAGIPISGDEAEKLRREMIFAYIKRWREEHPDQRIFNTDLNENIIINHTFLREATGHSAKSYLSTKAALRFELLIKEAKKVAVTKIKEGDNSQAGLQEMIVMKYEDIELGTVKLTVGVKLKSQDKIQYGISVPPGNQPLVDPKLLKQPKGNKKKKHLKK